MKRSGRRETQRRTARVDEAATRRTLPQPRSTCPRWTGVGSTTRTPRSARRTTTTRRRTSDGPHIRCRTVNAAAGTTDSPPHTLSASPSPCVLMCVRAVCQLCWCCCAGRVGRRGGAAEGAGQDQSRERSGATKADRHSHTLTHTHTHTHQHHHTHAVTTLSLTASLRLATAAVLLLVVCCVRAGGRFGFDCGCVRRCLAWRRRLAVIQCVRREAAVGRRRGVQKSDEGGRRHQQGAQALYQRLHTVRLPPLLHEQVRAMNSIDREHAIRSCALIHAAVSGDGVASRRNS